jgi:hypothetical protein
MKRSTSEYLSPSPSRCNTPDPSQTKSLSKSQLNLKRNPNYYSLFTSPSNWTDQVQYIPSPGHQPPLTHSQSMFVNHSEPDKRQRKVMTGVIKMWTNQPSLESRIWTETDALEKLRPGRRSCGLYDYGLTLPFNCDVEFIITVHHFENT